MLKRVWIPRIAGCVLAATVSGTAANPAAAGALAMVPSNEVSAYVFAIRQGDVWTEAVGDIFASGALSVTSSSSSSIEEHRVGHGRIDHHASSSQWGAGARASIGALAMVENPGGGNGPDIGYARVRNELVLSLTIANNSLDELSGFILTYQYSDFMPYFSSWADANALLSEEGYLGEAPMAYTSDVARLGASTVSSMLWISDLGIDMYGSTEAYRTSIGCSLPSAPLSPRASFARPVGTAGFVCGIGSPDHSQRFHFVYSPDAPGISGGGRRAPLGIGDSVTFSWTLAVEVEAWSVGFPVSEPASLPLLATALAGLALAAVATARPARSLTAEPPRP
jgi:hypothetical protein